jgi:hypothetical protein
MSYLRSLQAIMDEKDQGSVKKNNILLAVLHRLHIYRKNSECNIQFGSSILT